MTILEVFGAMPRPADRGVGRCRADRRGVPDGQVMFPRETLAFVASHHPVFCSGQGPDRDWTLALVSEARTNLEKVRKNSREMFPLWGRLGAPLVVTGETSMACLSCEERSLDQLCSTRNVDCRKS